MTEPSSAITGDPKTGPGVESLVTTVPVTVSRVSRAPSTVATSSLWSESSRGEANTGKPSSWVQTSRPEASSSLWRHPLRVAMTTSEHEDELD